MTERDIKPALIAWLDSIWRGATEDEFRRITDATSPLLAGHMYVLDRLTDPAVPGANDAFRLLMRQRAVRQAAIDRERGERVV